MKQLEEKVGLDLPEIGNLGTKMKHTAFEHVSWDDIEKSCLSMYARMQQSHYKPDVIIGVLKGGGIPASLFVDYFGVSMELASLTAKSYVGTNKVKKVELFPNFDIKDLKGKHVLVVDDIWDTGETMESILYEFGSEYSVTTATLFYRTKMIEAGSFNSSPHIDRSHTPDYYDKTVTNEWVVFPWEKYEFWRSIHGEKE